MDPGLTYTRKTFKYYQAFNYYNRSLCGQSDCCGGKFYLFQQLLMAIWCLLCVKYLNGWSSMAATYLMLRLFKIFYTLLYTCSSKINIVAVWVMVSGSQRVSLLNCTQVEVGDVDKAKTNTLVKNNLVDFWEITGFNLCLSLFIQLLSDSLPAKQHHLSGPYKTVGQHGSWSLVRFRHKKRLVGFRDSNLVKKSILRL